MSNVAKLIPETITIVFSFEQQFTSVVTLSLPSCTVTVLSGTDVVPLQILTGNPTVSGFTVSQKITLGYGGVIYGILCTAIGSDGNTYQSFQRVAVLTDNGSFGTGTGMVLNGSFPATACIHQAFYQTLVIVGGYQPFVSVTVSAGALPVGWTASIALNTLVLSGITSTLGGYSFTLRLVDFVGNVAFFPVTITLLDCTTYDEIVLADNPFFWYKLWGDSGTVAKDSIGVQDGVYGGAYTLNNLQLRTGGGLSTHFTAWPVDGSGDAGRVHITPSPTTFMDILIGQPYSIEAWSRMDVEYGSAYYAVTAPIFYLADNLTFGRINIQMVQLSMAINLKHIQAYAMHTPSLSAVVTTDPGTIPKDNIVHSIYAYDGEFAYLYVNGLTVSVSAIDTEIGTPFFSTSANPTLGGGGIGAAPLPNSPLSLNGNISDVIGYRSFITEAGALLRYNAGHL